MPELPEVETVCRGGSVHLTGRRLLAVELKRKDLRWPIPVRRVRALRGRCCTEVARRSKYVLMHFDGSREPVALVHLGMSGRMFVDVVEGVRRPEWELHEHWRMEFDGRLLRYVDPRRFGMLDVAYRDQLDEHELLVHLGPEPFVAAFSPEYLFARSRGRTAATKVFLMDAKTVVGVGNIYASESCFRAGIRPRRAAGRLTRRQCARLVDAVRAVLSDAIEAGGTTLQDYVGMDRDTGYFQRELCVYDRKGRPCPACGTAIKHAVVGQRATYWCPRCQT